MWKHLRVPFLVRAFAVALCFAAVGAEPLRAEIIEGTTGEGSQYALAVPENWNGVLVVYAHGIVPPFVPVALPAGSFNGLRDALMAQGVAVAYSSYSENGFAVKDGEQRTHQLLGLFKSRVGNPSYVYIIGHSLGAAITLGLAEKFPNQYDGALPMCGLVGGSGLVVSYLGDLRVLFDAQFPGVIPGEPFSIPPAVAANPLPTLGAVQSALVAGLATGKTQQLFAWADVQGNNVPEKIQSVVIGIGFTLVYTNDILARTHGHIPFDNVTTDYGAPGFDAIDAAVARFSATPDARNYIARYEMPTGDLQIPMVTLHTDRDPVVPRNLHQNRYRDLVTAAGNAERLRQRTAIAYGHCNFTPLQMFQAIAELRAWVEQGITPAP